VETGRARPASSSRQSRRSRQWWTLLAAGAASGGPEAPKRALADIDRALKASPRSVEAGCSRQNCTRPWRSGRGREAYRPLSGRPRSYSALNNWLGISRSTAATWRGDEVCRKGGGAGTQGAVVNDTLGWIYTKRAPISRQPHILRPRPRASPPTVVRYHLGKAYAGLGDQKKAVASLRKAMSLEGSSLGPMMRKRRSKNWRGRGVTDPPRPAERLSGW